MAKKDPAAEDFALHVLLIKRQENVTIAQARFIAWCEGKEGLQTRLGQK